MTTAGSDIWRPEDNHDLDALASTLQRKGEHGAYNPAIIDAIEATISLLSDELRELSLSIHGECYVCSGCACIYGEPNGFATVIYRSTRAQIRREVGCDVPHL